MSKRHGQNYLIRIGLHLQCLNFKMQIKLNMNKSKVKVLKARAKAPFILHKLYLVRSYTLIAY